MRLISPFLKKVVYPTLAMSGVFRRISGAGLAVVTYHGIFPAGYELVDAAFDGNLISAKRFRQQLRRLKKRFNVVAPEQVFSWLQNGHKLPGRAVLLTCDDGLLNNLTEMLPILQEERLKCLFFVTGASTEEERSMLWYEKLFLLLTYDLKMARGPRKNGGLRRFEVSCEGISIRGELGAPEQRRTIWWNLVKQLSQVEPEKRKVFIEKMQEHLASSTWRGFDPQDSVSCRRYAFMTRRELLQLAAAEMTIGAHTMSHPMLSQLPIELVRQEVAESRTRLEAVLQQKVWAFAYPFGDAQSVTPEVMKLAAEAGYAAAFLNYGGGLGVALPVHAIPRIHVTAKMSLPELEAHVSGFYTQLKSAGNIS